MMLNSNQNQIQNQHAFEGNQAYDSSVNQSRPAFITSKNIQEIALQNPSDQEEQHIQADGANRQEQNSVRTVDAQEITNDEQLRDDLEDDQDTQAIETQLLAAEQLTQQIIVMQAESKRLFQEGQHHSSVEIVDKIVGIRVEVEGAQSPPLIDYIVSVCRVFNQASIELMGHDEPDESLKMLQKTLEILEQVDQTNSKVISMISLTLNNTSCALKKKGEIHEAQECLEMALKKQQNIKILTQKNADVLTDKEEDSQNSEQNSTLFHLNLCALHSQKGNHMKAKTHASIAVKELETIVNSLKEQVLKMRFEEFSMQSPGDDEAEKTSQNDPSLQAAELEKFQEKLKEKIALLAIAYYNLGCEYEHLQQIENCIEAYQRAHQLEKTRNGTTNLAIQFSQCLRQAKLKQRAQIHQKILQQNKKLQESENKRKLKHLPKEVNPYSVNDKRTSHTTTPKRASKKKMRPQSANQGTVPIYIPKQQQDQEVINEDCKQHAISIPILQNIQKDAKTTQNTTLADGANEVTETTEAHNLMLNKSNNPQTGVMKQNGSGGSQPKNRPQSAAFSRGMKRGGPNAAGYSNQAKQSRLPISNNTKAMKSLGQVNWTKQWFSKAYVTSAQSSQQNEKEAAAVMNVLNKDKNQKAKQAKQLHLNERPPQPMMTSKILNRIRGSRQSLQSDAKVMNRRSVSQSNLHPNTDKVRKKDDRFVDQPGNAAAANHVQNNLEKTYEQELEKQSMIKRNIKVSESGELKPVCEYRDPSPPSRNKRPTSAKQKLMQQRNSLATPSSKQSKLPEIHRQKVSPVPVVIRTHKDAKPSQDYGAHKYDRKQTQPKTSTQKFSQTNKQNLMNFSFAKGQLDLQPEMQRRPAKIIQRRLPQARSKSQKKLQERNITPSLSSTQTNPKIPKRQTLLYETPKKPVKMEVIHNIVTKKKTLKEKIPRGRDATPKRPTTLPNLSSPVRQQKNAQDEKLGCKCPIRPNRPYEHTKDCPLESTKFGQANASKFRKANVSRKVQNIQHKIEVEKQKLVKEKDELKIVEKPESAEHSIGTINSAVHSKGTINSGKQTVELKDEEEVESAVIKIQAAYKGNQARSAVREKKEALAQENLKQSQSDDMERAALKIQATYKGNQARTAVREKKEALAQQDVQEKQSDKTLELDQIAQDKLQKNKIQSFIKTESDIQINERNQQMEEEIGQNSAIFDEVNQSRALVQKPASVVVEIEAQQSMPDQTNEDLQCVQTEENKIEEVDEELEKAALLIQQKLKKSIFKRLVQFSPIEEGEEVLVAAKIKDGHFKVQVVRLTAAKLGFKCINLDVPQQKQTEFIHQTGDFNAKFDSAESVRELLDVLRINPVNGTLSLPVQEVHVQDQERPDEHIIITESSAAAQRLITARDSRNMTEHKLLFKFNAIQDGLAELKEVLVNFENDSLEDISKGQVILRTAKDTKNKVQIPIKQKSPDISLDQLTKNLERYLPKIVYIDTSGFVQLVKNEDQKEKLNSQKNVSFSSRDAKGISDGDFIINTSPARSLKIQQKPSVDVVPNSRAENETQRAKKNSVLGQDSAVSSIPRNLCQVSVDIAFPQHGDKSEKATQKAISPLKHRLPLESNQSSIQLRQQRGEQCQEDTLKQRKTEVTTDRADDRAENILMMQSPPSSIRAMENNKNTPQFKAAKIEQPEKETYRQSKPVTAMQLESNKSHESSLDAQINIANDQFSLAPKQRPISSLKPSIIPIIHDVKPSHETQRANVKTIELQVESLTNPSIEMLVKKEVKLKGPKATDKSDNATVLANQDKAIDKESDVPSSINAAQKEVSHVIKVPGPEEVKAEVKTERAGKKEILEKESLNNSLHLNPIVEKPEPISLQTPAKFDGEMRLEKETQRATGAENQLAKETNPSELNEQVQPSVPQNYEQESFQLDTQTTPMEQALKGIPLRSDLSSIACSPQKESGVIVVDDWREGVQISFESKVDHSVIKLFENGVEKDKKMISQDIKEIAQNYESLSLQQFCNEWLMPCIEIKTSQKTGVMQLQVQAEMLHELVTKQYKMAALKSESQAAQTQKYGDLSQVQHSISGPHHPDKTFDEGQNKLIGLGNYDNFESKSELTKKKSNRTQGTKSVRSESQQEETKTVKQTSQLKIGENSTNLPLVKQTKIISGKEYTINAVCDFQNNQVVIKATDADQHEYSMYVEWNQPLKKDNQIDSKQLSPNSELKSINLQVATIVSNIEMNTEKGELTLRKAKVSVMEEKYILTRQTKEMGGNSFIVSAGYRDSQLILIAEDKVRNVLLELKIKWSMTKDPTSDDVMRFINKLDTQSIKVLIGGINEERQEILILKA